MRRSIVFPAVLIGLGAAGSAHADTVDFQLVSNSVAVDQASETATFSLTFDRSPDFIAIEDGQEQAFQYEIDADSNSLNDGINFGDIDTVVRGAEIWEGKGIPVRDRDGTGGANAGGWGPVRALLPFDIDGNTLTFTTGLSAIGDDDGKFRYRVFTTQNGAITGQAVGAVIPLPAAIWTGLTMLGGLSAARKLRRR